MGREESPWSTNLPARCEILSRHRLCLDLSQHSRDHKDFKNISRICRHSHHLVACKKIMKESTTARHLLGLLATSRIFWWILLRCLCAMDTKLHKIDSPTASTSMTVDLVNSFDCKTTRRGASSIKRMFKSAWSGKMTLDTSWRFHTVTRLWPIIQKGRLMPASLTSSAVEMNYSATNGEIAFFFHGNLGQYGQLLPTRCIPNVCTTNG